MQLALETSYLKSPPLRAAFPREDLPVFRQSVASSIREIGDAAWTACFPGELEGYNYLAAIEDAKLEGIDVRYALVRDQQLVLACMPAFHMMYSLTTTLDPGPVKTALEWLQRRVPKFMRLKMGCLGSPETECGLAGFHPSVENDRKPDILDRLIRAFEDDAKQAGCYLLAVKDAPASEQLWCTVAKTHRYTSMPGMATAHLDIDFKTTDDYLRRFRSATRKDLRRKLKCRDKVRVEYRHVIDDVLDEVYSFYLQTMARADLHLNTLPKAYFANVMAEMPDRSLVTLYYAGEKLIGANLLLVDSTRLLDKFFVMDDQEGRKHNLYFVSWFENLQYCLAHGIPHYQSGQACYDVKVRLKSYLRRNKLLFKHVKPGVNRIFHAAGPLFALDETETAS